MPAVSPLRDVDMIFALGADASRDPRLPTGFYARGWNVVNRGGVLRTRPGLKFRFNLPDGKLQGAAVFVPRRGAVQIVAVVDGKVYTSQPPFRTVRQICGIEMSATAKVVHFCLAEQAVKRNEDYSVSLLSEPKRVLFMQDGLSPATWFDGVNAGTQTGPNDLTPMGTAMAWSGFRLWVARGNEIFASDFGNPFSFVEGFYLGGVDSISMPRNVTAMQEIVGTGSPQLLVFTADSTTMVQSNILTRDLWPTTKDFVRTLFPQTGCISHRSIVSQFGGTWWFSQYGLTNFNLASATYLNSVFPLADLEMGDSKRHMSHSEGMIAGINFENMLLMSVPHGHKFNQHTWVLDQTAYRTLTSSGGPAAWSGVWNGFSPVEWIRYSDDGKDRVMAAITDGVHNQLVELDPDSTTDTGMDIECGAELRVLTHGTDALHEVRFGELFFSDIRGSLDLRTDWRGLDRGPYRECLTKRVEVGLGSIRQDRPIEAGNRIFALRPQSRRVWTRDLRETLSNPPDPCNIEGPGSPFRAGRDYGFQLLVRWSGTATFRGLRLAATTESEQTAGRCEEQEFPETQGHIRFDGFEGVSIEDLDTEPETYWSLQESTGTAHGETRTAQMASRSAVSQRAADKQARQGAQAQVALTLWEEAPPSQSPSHMMRVPV